MLVDDDHDDDARRDLHNSKRILLSHKNHKDGMKEAFGK